jgi:hypothetical protein
VWRGKGENNTERQWYEVLIMNSNTNRKVVQMNKVIEETQRRMKLVKENFGMTDERREMIDDILNGKSGAPLHESQFPPMVYGLLFKAHTLLAKACHENKLHQNDDLTVAILDAINNAMFAAVHTAIDKGVSTQCFEDASLTAVFDMFDV